MMMRKVCYETKTGKTERKEMYCSISIFTLIHNNLQQRKICDK